MYLYVALADPDCVLAGRTKIAIEAMASGRFMEEMMREHEQSLLEATCGGLFDHIDDLLDFPKEDSAADVLLLDAPAPGSPLAARVLDVGAAADTMPLPAKEQQPEFLALPPPLPARDDPAFMAALGDAHIGSVSCSPIIVF